VTSLRPGEPEYRGRQTAALALPPTPASALAARQAVSDFLGADSPKAGAVAVVVNELVTNAVVHAGTDIRLVLEYQEGEETVMVVVHDGVPPAQSGLGRGHRPQLRRATSGRGLVLVGRLSRDWGVQAEERGKAVWAVVPVN